MKKLFRGVIAKLLLVVAVAPIALFVPFWLDWRHFCAGGRRNNPNYHVAECVDLERVFFYLFQLFGLTLLPLALFLFVRLVLDRRRARNE
ncbi:MAG: hypothetical protein AAFN09_01910 [Pseudomonadota bacterium]